MTYVSECDLMLNRFHQTEQRRNVEASETNCHWSIGILPEKPFFIRSK